jgi:hypothetical protein
VCRLQTRLISYDDVVHSFSTNPAGPRSFNLAETGGVGFRARCSRKSYSQPRLCFIRGLTEPDRFFLFYLCFLLALSPFLAPESGGEFEEGDRFIFTEATSRPPYKRRAFS